MNGLKKFQEFALNAEEQKNVRGGRAVACYLSGATYPTYFSTEGAGDNWCSRRERCLGCVSFEV